MAGIYVGVVGYANDLLLLAPTREAAQQMLRSCEIFTKNSNIMFSTNDDPKKSTSKAMHVVAGYLNLGECLMPQVLTKCASECVI